MVRQDYTEIKYDTFSKLIIYCSGEECRSDDKSSVNLVCASHAMVYDNKSLKSNGDRPIKWTTTETGYISTGIDMTDIVQIKPVAYVDNIIVKHDVNPTYVSVYTESINECVCRLINHNTVDAESIIVYVIPPNCSDLNTQSVIKLGESYLTDGIRRNMIEQCPNTKVLVELLTPSYTDPGIMSTRSMLDVIRYNKNVNKPINFSRVVVGKYWKDKDTPHPLINFKQLMYNSNLPIIGDKVTYAVMDYPNGVTVGTRSGKPLFGVILSSTQDKNISTVIKTQESLSASSSKYLSVIDLRVIYSQRHKFLNGLFGVDCYNVDRRDTLRLNKEPLMTPVSPAGLATTTFNKVINMTSIYEHSKVKNYNGLNIIDITDQIYDSTDNGKLVCKCVNGDHSVKLNIHTKDFGDIVITAVYGSEILTTNQFRALRIFNVKVSIIVKVAIAKTLEYYLLVETPDITGVYCNYYTNKIY